MRVLPASAGVANPSILGALLGLLGKPMAEAGAPRIPAAAHAAPGGAALTWRFVSGREAGTPVRAGVAVPVGAGTDRAARPRRRAVAPVVQEADVPPVDGGDPVSPGSWPRRSGPADPLPSLRETVWVGLSAGSPVTAPTIAKRFVGWTPPTGGDETLGPVGFALLPHPDNEMLPDFSLADAERWAAGMAAPAYASDDQTAITVVDGTVAVVSEGRWKLFAPGERLSKPVAAW